MDKETRILKLTLIEAKLTHNTELFGKMDPFVKITSEQLLLKSKIIQKGGKTPKWNETFEIDPNYFGDEVTFTVLD
jgi:Ca2+-dependent lipid-binding protein